MKRRTPHTPGGFISPMVSQRDGSVTAPVTGHASPMESHERLIRQLDLEILLSDLL
ncbi:hypothetical protein SCMU_09270 [Sinomonas cyclohexanicum]|uniref:Uncharacterized protein n=1 Tax=Sinomonas cyclohexanicum TaxID=322009 RepID=A0ABN6FFB0_SINCY|nr:hypothetical protein [Corynebacterium cyclohexanicum]BCT75085.1 hypothetical protein SCMU_09270 [Corynebacterium cyclohexanicum]